MKNLLYFSIFALLHFIGWQANAGELSILENTTSENKHFAIITEASKSGLQNYWFYDLQKSVKSGLVVKGWMGITAHSVNFKTSWNSNTSMVAVVFYYGTKLHSTMLFERQKGIFKEIKFTASEPFFLFITKYPKNKILEGTTSREGSIDIPGPWIGNDTIQMLTADIRDTESNDMIYFPAIYKVRIQNGHAEIFDLKLLDKMTDSKFYELEKKFEKQK